MTDKKPFKDTKLGKFLKETAPSILDVVGNILPNKGVLGIVKNLIDKDQDMAPEDKFEAHQQIMELYRLEVEDRDSARKREVKLRQYGTDWMFNATGVVGLLAFAFLVYTVVTTNVPEGNKEIFIHMIGIVEGVALSIFGYYFGSAVKQNKN